MIRSCRAARYEVCTIELEVAGDVGGGPRRTSGKRWSQRVTERSSALDLEPGVFTWHDPRRIARSLKRSALQSTRRKGTPYQSAMSMLTFYINRAGRQLSPTRRAILNKAKGELHSVFGRDSAVAAVRGVSRTSRPQRSSRRTHASVTAT